MPKVTQRNQGQRLRKLVNSIKYREARCARLPRDCYGSKLRFSPVGVAWSAVNRHATSFLRHHSSLFARAWAFGYAVAPVVAGPAT